MTEGWTKTVDAMIEKGAKLEMPEDKDILVEYLVQQHGPLPEGEGRLILLNTCTICHDLQRVRTRRATPEGWKETPLPAVIVRPFGAGRVVYLAAAIDAALWSYAYPYQRCLLARALTWAAGNSSKRCRGRPATSAGAASPPDVPGGPTSHTSSRSSARQASASFSAWRW